MAYKKADIILPFILALSIAAVVLVSLYSSPVEKNDVLCGDTFITQKLANWSEIRWYPGETVNCKNTTGACTGTRYGTNFSLEPIRFQIWIVIIGVLFSSIPMLMDELGNKGGAYFLRLLGLYLSGICITVTLAIFLGNMTGTHSPTFIDSCKPNPPIQELCKAAVEGVRTYVKVNCTTSANKWDGPSFVSYRASSFPLLISLMSYCTSGFFLWSMMLSSKKVEEACVCRWFASIVSLIGMICIVCAAFFQLEAFLTDIGTGFALGFVVALMYLGMIVVMYPKWRKHSIIPTLPFTKYDLPPVKKGDKTAAVPASADSSTGENEKKPPTTVGENFYAPVYPSSLV